MLVQEGRIKVVLEKQDQCRVELGNVEAELKQLQEKKDWIMKQQEVVEKDVVVLRYMKEKLKASSEIGIKQQMEELEKTQEELKNVRRELDLAEGR